jgi:predicted Zn-dependent protease
MKRLLIPALILVISGAALYYSTRHKQETRVGPEAMLNALADTQRGLSRVPAAITRLSDEEEIRLGDSMAQGYTTRYALNQPDDAVLQDYVSKVGVIVAAHARRKLEYKFHYIPDENLINAFALPGGHVFIGKGFILLMDSEDELANILGHEVEHIDNYHCVERFQLREHLHDVPLAELLTLPVEFFQAGYTKDQELEADRDGTWLAVMAGYSPQGAVRMFEAFARLHREHVEKAESPDQELSKVAIAGLEGYFRSHPLPEERINQIQRIMATQKWPEHPEKALRVHPVSTKVAASNH